MPSFELLLPFIVATAVFASVPGPGMLYAAAQTIARGRRAGWHSAMGFHLAGYVHIAAAAFGLAVLLETIPLLYTALKLFGAAYLIWLGLRFLRARSGPPAAATRIEARPRGRALRESLTVELLNPKSALFFLAFLPQFTDPAAAFPVWAQILVLGTAVNLLFSTSDVVCVLLSDRIARLFAASRSAQRWAQRAGGGILVALGVNLAAARP